MTQTTDGTGLQRIAIVGSGGAGKSTLANSLGAQLGLPVIHLDEHYWQPGWVATPDDVWRERQRELVAGERWVVDGNFSSTMDLRFARADTAVVIALSRWRCLSRVLRRWITNRGRAVQAPGCPEAVSLEFLKWVWGYPSSGRLRLEAALAAHAAQVTVVELRTTSSVSAFLASLS